jgi:hypothetical protein
MANFWHLTRTLILTSAIVFGGVQLSAKMQPSHLAMLFTNPDGTPCKRPCLFGIRPGETPYEPAIRLLQTHPLTRSFESDTDRGVFSGQGISIIVFLSDSNLVSRIDLIRTSDSADVSWGTLGEVVAVLGPPQLVGVDAGSTRTYYLADSMMFFHSPGVADRVSVDERFDCLLVYGHRFELPDQFLASWQGFSSFQRYHTHMKHG